MKREVLIVDDRHHEIDWLIKLLEDFGYQWAHFSNEKDAKEHLQSTDLKIYLFAIIDIMIPVAKLEDLIELDEEFLADSRDTGIRICSFIRNDLGITSEQLPILAISARADDELVEALGRLDVVFYSRTDVGIRGHLAKLLSTQ